MSRVPLSNVDTAWLRMEDPTNLMMVTGVMFFDTPMDFERLKATLEYRLLSFDRFRRRVIQPGLPLSAPYWEDDARFDLDFHLKQITLPSPGDEAALQDVVSDLMSTQLDFSRPLWQMHLVENFGDGCALIARLHHCIADGLSLMYILLSLADTDPNAPWPTAQPEATKKRGQGLWGPARSAIRTTTQVAGTLLHGSMETLANPSHALDLARMGTDGATALGRLVLRWPDPQTLFKGKLGVSKRAVWSRSLLLKDVKAIGRVKDATINDVLLAVIAGALRRYMQGRDEPVEDVEIRGVLPVNLRPPGVESTLGNRFGLVFLTLPVGVAGPIDRMLEIKQRMDGLKGTPEAVVAFGILNAIGMAPSEIQNIVVDIFGTKGTAVITNVPGPREQLYLAGAPMNTVMGWVPQAGHLSLGISIISYAGQVRLGIAADHGLVPDPETIIAAIHAEFDELSDLAQRIKPPPSKIVKPMIDQLDEAIKSLDVLLDGKQPARKAAGPKGQPHCQAKTQAGEPCKRRPLPGSRFCRAHQKREGTSVQPARRASQKKRTK